MIIIFLLLQPCISKTQEKYPPSKKIERPVAKIAPLLANRFYIYKFLKGVFGVSSEEILFENILKRTNLFNGPCDIYEQVRPSLEEVESRNSKCFSGSPSFKLPINADIRLLSSALMIKTCNALVNNENSFNSVLEKLGEKRVVDFLALEKAIKIFHPHQTPQARTINKLLTLSKKSGNANWKWIFYTLCLDPSWRQL